LSEILCAGVGTPRGGDRGCHRPAAPQGDVVDVPLTPMDATSASSASSGRRPAPRRGGRGSAGFCHGSGVKYGSLRDLGPALVAARHWCGRLRRRC